MLLVGAGLFYILYRDDLSLLTLLLAFLVPLVLLILAAVQCFCLSARVQSESTAVNKAAGITLTAMLKNPLCLPLPRAVAEFEYQNHFSRTSEKKKIWVSLEPGRVQTLSFQISSEYCGKITFRLKKLKVYDYLQLFSFSRRTREMLTVTVLPQCLKPELSVQLYHNQYVDSDLFSKQKSGDDPSEVFQLREFRDGDKLNRIHWKLSTKQDSFIVKEYSLPISSAVYILFEFSAAPLPMLDTQVETLYALCRFLTEEEVTHDVGWHGPHGFSDANISTEEDLQVFMKQLMNTQPYQTGPESALVLLESEKLNSARHYSHLIYITTQLAGKTPSYLSSQDCAEHLTVLYITDRTEEEVRADSVDLLELVQVRAVPPGEILSALADFTL